MAMCHDEEGLVPLVAYIHVCDLQAVVTIKPRIYLNKCDYADSFKTR